MKTIKKTHLLPTFCLILIVCNLSSMDQPQSKRRRSSSSSQRKRSWSQKVADALQQLIPVREVLDEPDFTKLPTDTQTQIMGLIIAASNAQLLEIAAHNINSLAQVNHELNEHINDPKYCLEIIKYLAQRFGYSDFTVCKTLQTFAAKQRLDIQIKLYDICLSQNPSIEAFRKISPDADLTFTYEYSMSQDMPLLQIMILETSTVNPLFEEFIQIEPKTINLATSTGITPLMIAIRENKWPYIQALLNSNNIDVNKQDSSGNTALMYAIESNQISPILIEQLLQAGANPHFSDNKGITPLKATEKLKDSKARRKIQQLIRKYEG